INISNYNDNINHEKLSKIFKVALSKKYKYLWIDTLCIDKTSSSELSENLVSMYKIYKDAK
ncbi:hypothetical protein K492DRAFT_108794, partial [Lichtheimia hyalospora FSU 10163]